MRTAGQKVNIEKLTTIEAIMNNMGVFDLAAMTTGNSIIVLYTPRQIQYSG